MEKNFLQTNGTAMGTKTAVSFANIFMAKIETAIIEKLRNNPPSVYDIVEKVLIRYPTAKKLYSKRCVSPARVLKRNLRTCKYKVKFTYPAKSSNTLRKWISVNDITSTTMNKEHEKKKLARQSSKKKQKKILYSFPK